MKLKNDLVLSYLADASELDSSAYLGTWESNIPGRLPAGLFRIHEISRVLSFGL
jgi:hypothetical protein